MTRTESPADMTTDERADAIRRAEAHTYPDCIKKGTDQAIMRRLSITTITAAILLSGCTSQQAEWWTTPIGQPTSTEREAAFETTLRSNKGKTESEIVAAHGIPAATYEADGHRYLAYRAGQQVAYATPGTGIYAPDYGTGNGWNKTGQNIGAMIGGSTPPSLQGVEYGCEVTYDLVAGKVIAIMYQGNACY